MMKKDAVIAIYMDSDFAMTILSLVFFNAYYAGLPVEFLIVLPSVVPYARINKHFKSLTYFYWKACTNSTLKYFKT